MCWITTPSQPRVTCPLARSWGRICLAMLIGTAKPIVLARGLMAVLMPITSPAQVDQRTARVARIDGGVGLDEVVVAPWPMTRCLALTMPAVTVCSRPKGLPIATTHSPGRTRVGVAQRQGEELLVGLDADQGDVGLGVAAHDLGFELGAVREGHLDAVHVLDHVVVGHDVAVGGDHEAAAEARNLARAAAAGRRGRRRRTPRSRGQLPAGTVFDVWMFTTPGETRSARSAKLAGTPRGTIGSAPEPSRSRRARPSRLASLRRPAEEVDRLRDVVAPVHADVEHARRPPAAITATRATRNMPSDATLHESSPSRRGRGHGAWCAFLPRLGPRLGRSASSRAFRGRREQRAAQTSGIVTLYRPAPR